MSQQRMRAPLFSSPESTLSRWVADLRKMNFVTFPVESKDIKRSTIEQDKLADSVRQRIWLEST